MAGITTAIVGTRYRGPDAMARLAKLAAGDVLILRREPHNEHDSGAVAVYQGGAHLGYIPTQSNGNVGKAMDAGKAVTAWCHAEALMAGKDVAPGGLPKIAVKWED